MSSMKSLRPAVFFDRDGVINEPPSDDQRYLRSWEEFRFVEGMLDVLAAVKTRGYVTILITNQQGVGKGLMTIGQLEKLHESMQDRLRESEVPFDAIYAATGLAGEDPRRKPSPAMLLEAAEDHGIDLARSWMVGDHDNDMRAGHGAGAGTIRVVGRKSVSVESDHEVRSAGELASLLERVLD